MNKYQEQHLHNLNMLAMDLYDEMERLNDCDFEDDVSILLESLAELIHNHGDKDLAGFAPRAATVLYDYRDTNPDEDRIRAGMLSLVVGYIELLTPEA